MKRLMLGLILLGGITMSSHATFYNAVNVLSVQSGSDGTTYFQTDGGFPSDRWWLIVPSKMANADAAKSMVTTLLTAKAAGIPIQFEDWGSQTANFYYVKTIRMQ
jgi:hypothetical protein